MNAIAVVSVILMGLSAGAQSISSEKVEFQSVNQPSESVEEANRNFNVTVTSPYSLTAEDIVKKSKEDHALAVKNYDQTVAQSKVDYNEKLKEHDADVAKAKSTYELEQTEFKKLSMLERLTMTEAGKNPKLVLPTKPVYVKPAPPVYQEPNLKNFSIVDNNVLASQINIDGYSRGANYVDVNVDIKSPTFQDNNGQTFINQPTKVVVKVNGVEKLNTVLFKDFAFLSSVPSNNIDKASEEKRHLTKVIAGVNALLNQKFGYTAANKTIVLQSVKNKGQYDDLAKADIYVTTNLKKLQPGAAESNQIAYANMQKGIDIWNAALQKIDYKNPKADFNAKIAQFVYFNLIRLNVALNRKTEAEKILNQLQENLIYIKLSSSEESELAKLEKEIYSKK
ncbi:hypothetical protein [Flavobacterium sp.]|uniref:hypothetical protein n=1 Tax=Flavobacterium sp. TaxID=239 RepID=UPI001229F325|nr:hypothetical protein [Flavobacterium sp.]RZJ72953.1 MAG: hypothetical protein EOO49_04805 [Flavobacterium sp.]